MIEKIILDYLLETLNVDVYLEKPDNPPERYVLIEKTSGFKENHISTATFAVQSYAESLFFAAELNVEVINAMDNLVNLKEIGSSKYNTDYNYTDTSKKIYRYQAIYDVTY